MNRPLIALIMLACMFGIAANVFALQAEIPSESRSVAAKEDPKITVGGEIEIRGWYTKGVGSSTTEDDKMAQKEPSEKSSKQTHTTQGSK